MPGDSLSLAVLIGCEPYGFCLFRFCFQCANQSLFVCRNFIIGFWRKVKPALSAGRVQSVAVRLIVEREREIHAFKSEAAYRVTAVFLVPDTDGKLVEMKAELAHRIKTKKEAEAFLNACKGAGRTDCFMCLLCPFGFRFKVTRMHITFTHHFDDSILTAYGCKFRQVHGVGTHIGDKSRFVQTLGNHHSLRHRIA